MGYAQPTASKAFRPHDSRIMQHLTPVDIFKIAYEASMSSTMLVCYNTCDEKTECNMYRSERSSETVSEAASEASTAHRTSAETGTEDTGSITEAMSETESTAVTERPDYRALDYVTVGQYRQLPVETDEITVTDEDIDAALRAAIPAEDYADVPDGVEPST